MKTTVISEPFLNFPKSRLSEGPTYNPVDNSLLWVDIIAQEIHRVFLPITGEQEGDFSADNMKEIINSHEVLKVPGPVGVIGLTKNPNVYVCGCDNGVLVVDFSTGSFEYKLEFPTDVHDPSIYRSNDGSVDPHGNFWVGTMINFKQPGPPEGGSLYRVNTDLTVDTMIAGGCKIPNGILWLNGKMYWTDSLTFTIWKFDYDLKTGLISNRQPHINIKDHVKGFDSPEPDGFVMTESGDILTAVFSTSRIYRFNIEGELIEEFVFPAKRITCPTLGGEHFNEMYVTSADLHLDDPDKVDSEQPEDYGGAIFRVVLDRSVKGQPKNIWGGLI